MNLLLIRHPLYYPLLRRPITSQAQSITYDYFVELPNSIIKTDIWVGTNFRVMAGPSDGFQWLGEAENKTEIEN